MIPTCFLSHAHISPSRQVIEWTPGGTLPEADWQVPAYCFEVEGGEQVHLEEQWQKVRLSMA